MKELYMASFVHNNGILGGVLYLTDTMTIFRTNKLTIAKKYRNLQLRYEDIFDCIGGWSFCLPIVTIIMQDRKEYRFVVFAKNKYLNRLSELRK